jgi:hypothetical protein
MEIWLCADAGRRAPPTPLSESSVQLTKSLLGPKRIIISSGCLNLAQSSQVLVMSAPRKLGVGGAARQKLPLHQSVQPFR